MARFLRKRWESSIAEGLTRRDRKSCDYDSYLPDSLLDRTIWLDGDVAADIADAERGIERLDAQASALVDTEALARLLLRAESVASSRIEGLEIGSRQLLRAEMARDLGELHRDVTAEEVLANIDAMQWSIGEISKNETNGRAITVDHILETHRRLLADTRLSEHAGQLRQEQNWIGGSGYNPCSAAYVPPPPERVGALLEDLVSFCNRDALPAVAQAAIAHAQFETIHPFVDGNGRVGRALIHLVLIRRGPSRRVLVPISLILATWSRDYIEGLTRTRYRGSARSKDAQAGLNQWVAFFSKACQRAAEDALTFESRIVQLQTSWRERLGRIRSKSAADLLIDRLPGAPIVTTASAASLIGRSFQSTNEAIDRLVDAGILTQITLGRRNRAFEVPDVIAAFTALERRLASPRGDTKVSPPVRKVPHRR